MAKGKKGTALAILCMSAMMNTYMCLSPILVNIGQSFPELGASQLQMIFTVISLVALPVMLLVGYLNKFISKKSIALIGLVLMLIGGLLPTFLNTQVWMLYLSSAVIGCGMAHLNVISSALISDNYQGLQKGTIMGFQSAAVSIGGGAASLLGGNIAAWAGWTYSYFVYLLAIPVLFIVALGLPKDQPVRQESQDSGSSGKVVSGRLLLWAAMAFVGAVAINAFSANIAMYLDQTGMGDSAVAGIVNSMFMLIGIPAGLLLGRIIKLCGRNTVGFATILAMLGMFCIAWAQSVVLVILGAFLVGCAFAVRNPTSITFAANMVPAYGAALGIAIHNACSSVGNFLSPIIINWINGFVSGGNIRTVFVISGVILAVLSACYLLFNPVRKEEVA